ncbi:MAG: hypothetical protein ACO1N0_17720 [Fluviicola sp.]
MKSSFLIPFILLILVSCKKEIHHTFYYKEGTEIKNTTQLALLNMQLVKLVSKEDLNVNLKIKTTLSQKQSVDFFRISNDYKNTVLEHLKSNYPKHGSFLDSLHMKGRLSNISVIVINNKTGEVENCNSNSQSALFDPNMEHRALEPYGYIMTFDKGKALNDTFAFNLNPTNTPKYSPIFQIPAGVTVSHSFIKVPGGGGNIMLRPYDYYPLSDWKKLEKKLEIDLDLSEYRTGHFSWIKTSLFDLVKTISMIQNNGEGVNPVFIRSIRNETNNRIYTYKKSSNKRILSASTTQNMKQLFKNYMTQGPGIKHYRSNGIIEDCFFFSGRHGEHKNWLIYTNDLYTFGMVEYNILQTVENDYNIRRREKFKLSSMMKDILRKMNLNMEKGKNIQSLEIPEEVIIVL